MKNNKENNEEFFSLGFYVDSRVLIPRNETEILVEEAIKEFNNHGITYIDIGTGSGCILISILKNIKYNLTQAYGLDISEKALEVALINLQKYNLNKKVILKKTNLLELFLKNTIQLNSKKIIITANLPYIKNGDFGNMDENVIKNEPHIALFGGEKTGFELYEKLISQIQKIKENREIVLFIEIGFDQYYYSSNFLEKHGLKYKYYKDYSNINRVIRINFLKKDSFLNESIEFK